MSQPYFTDQTYARGASGVPASTFSGKTTVYYSATPPPGTDYIVNDLWFETDNQHKIYRWTGTVWDAIPLGTAAFSELDASIVRAGTIQGDKFAIGVLSANLVPDPSFEELALGDIPEWNLFGGLGIDETVLRRWHSDQVVEAGNLVQCIDGESRSGRRSIRIKAPFGGGEGVVSGVFRLDPTKTYQLSLWACSIVDNATLAVAVLSGTTPGNVWYLNDAPIEGDSTWIQPPLVTEPVKASDYVQYSYEITPIVGREWYRVRINNFGPSSADALLLVDDVAVVEKGTGAAEITGAGIRLFGPTGNEIGAFVSNRPNYFTISDDQGEAVGSWDENGRLSAAEITIEGRDDDGDGTPESGFMVYGKEFSEYINENTSKLVAYGKRTTNTVLSTSEQPHMQLDFPYVGGRQYLVVASGFLSNDTTGGRALARIRLTTDGTTPGITSTPVQLYRTQGMYTGTGSVPFMMRSAIGVATPGNYEYSALLTCEAEGSGQARLTSGGGNPVEMWVYDEGPFIEDTGIDRTVAVPVASKRTYQSVWTATNSESYKGNLSARTDTTDLVQGYNSANGDGHAVVVFGGTASSGETTKTIASALSGATISKVEVYLYASHWYYNNGGTAIIRAYNSTGLSSSTPTGTIVHSTGWPKPGGRWVNITSIATTAIRGITLGKSGGTNLVYYGRFNSHANSSGKPAIRITYVR